MTPPRIRPARADEHAAVSALALASKGHWGYSAEFLEACRVELTYDAETCASGRMWVAEADDALAGFVLLEGEPPAGELAALFVDPAAIGTGVGGLLLRHALHEAAVRGFTRLSLDADPGAEAFYLHHGAVRTGESPSGSVPGRVLPRLEISAAGRTAPAPAPGVP
ncbi:MAG: GNAT family N-acetyltransferase [Nocardioides sp.]|uniref:GNAT family N-acetyltransferase n=1 Tax=Nocardioides sp. TaxID=35761 RepID=UPI003EFF2130